MQTLKRKTNETGDSYSFCFAGNGAPVLGSVTDIVENVGQWHHYVFQHEGSTLRVWCDESLLGSYADANGNMGEGVDFSINSFSLGAEGGMEHTEQIQER